MKSAFLLLMIMVFLMPSCKNGFLEIKPDKKLVIPSTLQDFQGMVDYSQVMNAFMPSLGEVSSDDYYILYEEWKVLSQPQDKNGYIWAEDVYEGNTDPDWKRRYQQVFYANNILEGLDRLKAIEDIEWYNHIKGSAYFFRAFAFFQLAQLYCDTYDKQKDNSGYGIPLRLNSDLNIPTRRSTVRETYEQIISDLNKSVKLLPVSSIYKTRPVKTAAFALLSRTYLIMQEYDKALAFADSVLSSNNYSLMDFNELDTSSAYPMKRYNSEVILQSTLAPVAILLPSRLIIDSTLYRSYSEGDIRKSAWFKINHGNITFKGSYDGSLINFNGLAIDECYLTKSECLARKGKTDKALEMLNKLLKKRFRTGTFMPVNASNSDDALTIILQERRKELLFRGIRWSDLRRLNLAKHTSKTLYRKLNGVTYELEPNSLNYTLPIPDKVIQLSGIPQNKRE